MRKTCRNGGPHKFEPRHDKEMPPGLKLEWGDSDPDLIEKIFEMSVKTTYVCDVCEWCGKVIDYKGET